MEPTAAPGARPDDDVVTEELRAALAPGYQLIRLIGVGGMGRVYLARDPQLKRLVAVKVLLRELTGQTDARARFLREAEVVAALSHPNVVGIHGLGALGDGTPYFVMQYVSGRSLADWLRADGPLDVNTTKRILGEVATALAAAHRHGIVHRDIKPANILFDEEARRALVSDFGIAAIVSTRAAADGTNITRTGMTVGTLAYMSPEQIAGEQVSEKTDVYALGLLGYELLTARGPYEISSPRDLIAAHLRDTPAKLSDRRADVPPDLEQLLAACLSKSADDRPTAQHVAERLTNATGEVLEWPPPALELLQGAAVVPLVRLRLGVLFLVASVAVSMALDIGTVLASSYMAPLIFLGLAIIGIVLILLAASRMTRIRRAGSRATQLGYSFATILEVLADRRRDGGDLDRKSTRLNSSHVSE